jgi:hypothetical protein
MSQPQLQLKSKQQNHADQPPKPEWLGMVILRIFSEVTPENRTLILLKIMFFA